MAAAESDNYFKLKTFFDQKVSGFLRDLILYSCGSIDNLKNIVRTYRSNSNNNHVSISNKDYGTIQKLRDNLKPLKMELLLKLFSSGMSNTTFHHYGMNWTITDHPPAGNEVDILNDVKRLLWLWKHKLKAAEDDEEMSLDDSCNCWSMLTEVSGRLAGTEEHEEVARLGNLLKEATEAARRSSEITEFDDGNPSQAVSTEDEHGREENLDSNMNAQIGDNNQMNVNLSGCYPSYNYFMQSGTGLQMNLQLVDLQKVSHIDFHSLGPPHLPIDDASSRENTPRGFRLVVHPRDPNNDSLRGLQLSSNDRAVLEEVANERGLTIEGIESGCLIIDVTATKDVKIEDVKRIVDFLLSSKSLGPRLSEQSVMTLDWIVYYYARDMFKDYIKEPAEAKRHFTLREVSGPIVDIEIHADEDWYHHQKTETGKQFLRVTLVNTVVDPDVKLTENAYFPSSVRTMTLRDTLNELLENSNFCEIVDVEDICSNGANLYIALAPGVNYDTLTHKDGPLSFLIKKLLDFKEGPFPHLSMCTLVKFDVFISKSGKHWCTPELSLPATGSLDITLSTKDETRTYLDKSTITLLLEKLFFGLKEKQLKDASNLDLVVLYGETEAFRTMSHSEQLGKPLPVTDVRQVSTEQRLSLSSANSNILRLSSSEVDSQSDIPDSLSDLSDVLSVASDRAIVYEDPEFDSNDEIASVADSGYSSISSMSLFDRSDNEYMKLKEQHQLSRKVMDDSELLTKGVSLSMACKLRYRDKSDNIYPPFKTDKDEMKFLLETSPDRFKRCSVEIVSAHRAVCTNLDEKDQIKEIHISGRSKCGKAYGEDEVLVEILDTGESSKLTNYIQRLRKDLRKSIVVQNKAYGQVVGIMRRHRFPEIEHPVFVCTLDEFENHFAKPICKTVPKIHLLHDKCEKWEFQVYEYDPKTEEIKPRDPPEIRKVDQIYKKTLIFLVAVIHWERLYPLGAIIKVFDSTGNMKSSLDILKLQYQIMSLYRYETVQQVKSILRDEPAGSLEENREKLSNNIPVFTIDPPDAYVLDDAISLEELGNDNYRVGIHVSDVCCFVHKDDDIDLEARERAVTFYPGPRLTAYHMLPEPICTDFCSLREGEERNAISVFYEMSSDGQCLRVPEVRKTRITSQRQYTYDEVQRILDDDVVDRNAETFRVLLNLAKILKANRLKTARFATPVKLGILEEDDIEVQSKDAYELVSEWMIFTNVFTANYLSKISPHIPLRLQGSPSLTKVGAWMKKHDKVAFMILAVQNYCITDLHSSRFLSIDDESVASIRYRWLIPTQKWVWSKIIDKSLALQEKQNLITSDCLHPLQALAYDEWTNFQPYAQYRCTQSRQTDDLIHFGLQVPYYAHFTSPLRRFIDLITQRMIVAAIDGTSFPYSQIEIQDICEHANEVCKRSMQFQSHSKRFLLGYTMQRKPVVVHAFVKDISLSELTLYIPGFRGLPDACLILPTNMLGTASQPTLKTDRDTGKEILELQWEKRIYCLDKRQTIREKRLKCQKINPHSKSEFHHMAKWVNILMAVVNHPANLDNAVFDDNHPNESNLRAVSECYDTVFDVNSEYDVKNGKQTCEFSMTFSYGQVIALQLSGEPDQGVILPSIQLFDMTRSVKFCLQHMSDPVGKLAHYAVRGSDDLMKKLIRKKKGSKENKLLLEYIKTWMAIIHIETATNAVQDDSITITNVPVTFDGVRKGHFLLESIFCLIRDIELTKMNINFFTSQHDSEESAAGADFLCIRCEISSSSMPLEWTKADIPPNERRFWIAHAKITDISETEKRHTRIGFAIHRESQGAQESWIGSKSAKCSVEILPKPNVDKRMEIILKSLEYTSPLAKAVILRKAFPKLGRDRKRIVQSIDIDVRCKGLRENNESQRRAIQQALRSSFSIIQGPPGTGKSFTGIKLLYLFWTINRDWMERKGEKKIVIFSGPSNKSVDMVAVWFRRHMRNLDKDISIARFYGSSLENIDYPVPCKVYSKRRSQRDGKPQSSLKPISVHHMIRKDKEKYAETLKGFDAKFARPDYKPDMRDIKEYRKTLSLAVQDELQKHDVIFCTTAVTTSSRFLGGLQGRICQLIIDEAGMCTEPETVSTIVATQAEQVVLIGDHKQLRPIVVCQKAASLGLEKSLFEQYAEQGHFLTFLNVQYRMHEMICEFPSRKFYDGKLKTATERKMAPTENLKIWPNPSVPLVLCHVEGEEFSLPCTTPEGNEASCSNDDEVKQVVKIYHHLVDRENIHPRNINIMSQYNAQCHDLRKALKGIQGVQVNTVFSSQGSEWDYIIFSTVRSLPDYRIEPKPTTGWCIEALGFITDEHQINVALTRAKKGLIIVGNKKLLKCEDKVWKDLVEHYEKMGCIVNGKDFPKENKSHRIRRPKQPEETEAEFYAGTDREEDFLRTLEDSLL